MTSITSINRRRGLFNIDGEQLDKHIIVAGFNGSVLDMDIIRSSISKSIINMTTIHLARISTEFCILHGRWPVNLFAESFMHADCVLSDWQKFGEPSFDSLYDIIISYVDHINDIGECLPRRQLESKHLKHDQTYPYAPYTIFPATEPNEYLFGKNDCVNDLNDPLLTHVLNKKCKLVKNGIIYGGAKHDNCYDTTKSISFQPSFKQAVQIDQSDKIKEIKDKIKEIKPTSVFMLNEFARCSVLLNVSEQTLDLASMWKFVDYIEAKYSTPFDCLVVDNKTFAGLVNDKFDNDAKRILDGELLIGDSFSFKSKNMIRLITISEDDMLYNFDQYGFETFGGINMPPQIISIRPEYVIAAAFYKHSPRMYITGVAAVLYKNDIDWQLLLYLAKMGLCACYMD